MIGSPFLYPSQFANGLSKDERINTVARARCSQNEERFCSEKEIKCQWLSVITKWLFQTELSVSHFQYIHSLVFRFLSIA